VVGRPDASAAEPDAASVTPKKLVWQEKRWATLVACAADRVACCSCHRCEAGDEDEDEFQGLAKNTKFPYAAAHPSAFCSPASGMPATENPA
jgi:hypothetical protein